MLKNKRRLHVDLHMFFSVEWGILFMNLYTGGGPQLVGFGVSVRYNRETGKPEFRFLQKAQNRRQTGKPDFFIGNFPAHENFILSLFLGRGSFISFPHYNFRKIAGKLANRNYGFRNNLKIAGKLKYCLN